MKPKFVTKFDVTPFAGCEMNPYDAVDRLSYVDSTTQIVRMLSAGVNMRLQNSQLMCTDGDMNAPSMPVYAPDISVAYAKLHEMKEQLKENQRLKTEALEKLKADKLKAEVSPDKGTNSDLPSST